MKRQILLIVLFCSPLFALPQVVYQDLTNTGIYDFMDELANLRIIDVTSAVKPYSRIFIAEKLKEASAVKEKMNKRQKKELDFYLRDYNLELKPDLSYFKKKNKGMFKKKEHIGIPLSPLALVYKDSLFTFSFRPIYGVYGYVPENNQNNVYHRWGGIEIFGTIGRHVGFYTSMRDNHESELLVNRGYLTTEEGAAWKESPKGGDYSEVRGGVTFAWNWGSVLLAKDHFQWGDNYHGSNILSGRTPSFPFLQLSMKPARWFSFQFVTAMLISEVVDTSRTYNVPGGLREYYFNKFLSAAMITFTPWRGLDLSIGNSVVSCSQSYNPAYLSPFLFYTSPPSSGDSAQKASHGSNSQLFFNISSRQIKHLHLYASVFIDDLATTKFNDTTYTSISWKAGFRLSNLFNLSLTAEYTRTSPKTYSSPVSTQTFESNRYCMGNYLRDNSQELFASLGYRPVRGLMFNLSYNKAEHGGMFDKKTLATTSWTYEAVKADVTYEFINNAYVSIGYQYLAITGDESLSPGIFMGTQNMLCGGINIGF
ncbi:MAG: hypothetical protein NTU98_09525 [Bacteroidetes bacterium]|nr:hypothetical protein [Bacteroidota bacterium]